MAHAVAGQRGRGGTIIGSTVATWAMQGSGPMPSASRSAAVKTPSTPGMVARRGGVDAARSRAWACGERTTCIVSSPGKAMSST